MLAYVTVVQAVSILKALKNMFHLSFNSNYRTSLKLPLVVRKSTRDRQKSLMSTLSR